MLPAAHCGTACIEMLSRAVNYCWYPNEIGRLEVEEAPTVA